MNKFILSENIKHILTEKYLLDERYILTEATDNLDVAIAWGNEIKKHLPKVKEIINKAKNSLNPTKKDINLNNLVKDIDTARTSVRNSQQLPVKENRANESLKVSLNEYSKAVSNIITALDTASTGYDEIHGQNGLLATLEKFNSLLSTRAWTLPNQRKALDIYKKLDEAVQATFKQVTPITTEADGELQRICNKALEMADQLESNYLFNNKSVEIDETVLDKYLSTLKGPLQSAINNITANQNITTKPKDDVIDIFNSFINACEAVKEAADNTAIKRANSQQQDWMARYKSCTTEEEFDSFWKDYFTLEWKDKAAAVKEFGIVFIEDLEKNGFDTINNALVKFLKTPIIYNLLGKTFGLAAYTVIRNAVVNGLINGGDLKASDSSLFRTSNIIFNPALYENITSATDYLKIQSRLGNSGSSNSLETTIQQIWNTNGRNGHIKVLNNLILAEGDGDNFSKEIVSANKALPLRSLDTAKQILEQITGSSFDDKLDATNKDVESILRGIRGVHYAQGILAYLIDYCLFNDMATAVNKADDTVKAANNNGIFTLYQQTPRPDRKTAEDYDAKLRLKDLDFKQPELIDLLLGLAERAGIYEPTQKNKK